MLRQHIYSFVILLASNLTSYSHTLPINILSEDDLANFAIIDACVPHTGTDAYIRKVSDGNSIYILKQIRNVSLYEQFLLINEVIASTIGYRAGINVNEVFFIPYDIASHLKIYPERAATLHAYVPGKDLEQEFSAFFPINFTLQQRVVKPDSPWQKKYPLDVHQQGLTKTLIESMCFHDNLSSIVALDTFIGNSDRSLPNIFYDQRNNCFYGIDQAAAFSRTLPLFACDRLKDFLIEGYFDTCSSKIIYSLRMYRAMLLQLKERIRPPMIMQMMQQLASHLGSNALQDSEIQARIQHHSFVIEHNYQHTLCLIELLDRILQ